MLSSSRKIEPFLTRLTQNCSFPLPLPIRLSSGLDFKGILKSKLNQIFENL